MSSSKPRIFCSPSEQKRKKKPESFKKKHILQNQEEDHKSLEGGQGWREGARRNLNGTTDYVNDLREPSRKMLGFLKEQREMRGEMVRLYMGILVIS